MSDYLKRFEAMVNDLKRYDFIEMLEFSPQRPVTASQLKTVEKALGGPIDESLRNFYEETNGLKIHWRIQRDLGVQEAKKLRKKSTDYTLKIAEYVGDPFAIINLIPIHESIGKNWKEPMMGVTEKKVDFGGKPQSVSDFAKRLKPFDVISREYCMAFLFQTGVSKPQVLLLTEGYTDWTSSRVTDFESYLEMLLVTRGIVEARLKLFGKERGDMEPTLTGGAQFWQKKGTPRIFGKK